MQELQLDYSFKQRETDALKHLERCQYDFKYFFCHVVLKAKFGDQWAEKFYFSPSFLVQCDYIVAAIKGKVLELAVAIPPRNSKSLLWSVALPMFILMRDGSETVLSVSHHDDVLEEFHANRRLVFNNEDYQKIITWQLTTDKTDMMRTTAGGHILSMVMEYIKTGLGANWLIVDDPISSAKADNPDFCKKIRKRFTGSLLSRSDNKKDGRMLVISQRLSENDITGLVIKEGEYTYLELQAIADEPQEVLLPNSNCVWRRAKGDVLNPSYEPLEVLLKYKRLDPDMFASQYQQRPVVIGNFVFEKGALRYYLKPQEQYDEIYISVDTASSLGVRSANWGVIVAGKYNREGRSCLDVLFAEARQYEYPEGKKRVLDLIAQYCVTKALIEAKSTGTALVPELKEKKITTYPMQTKESKEARFIEAMPFISQGRLYLPDTDANPFVAAWVNLIIYELQGFPSVAKKDLVDASAHLINFVKLQKFDARAFFRLGQ